MSSNDRRMSSASTLGGGAAGSRRSIQPYRIVTLAMGLSLESEGGGGGRPISFIQRAQQLAAQAQAGAGTNPTSPIPGLQGGGRASVEAVELCGSSLYVGTSDGNLFHCIMTTKEAGTDEHPEIVFQVEAKRNLGLGRKMIERILAVPTEGKLLVLCDGSLNVFHLETLAPLSMVIAPIRGVMTFCSDPLIESPLRICVAKRRVLHALMLGETFHGDKDIGLTDGAITMVRYGSTVCLADQVAYKMVNLDRGTVSPLFSYDRVAMRPLVTVVGEDEFLVVTAQNQFGLGVFINSNGDPIRGTLQWPSLPKSIAFQSPYVLALLKNNVVEVHNMYTQQKVQSISIPSNVEPRFVVEASYSYEITTSENKTTSTIQVVVCGKETVVGLRMTSIDGQIDELLEGSQIERAVKLAESIAQGETDEGDRKRAILLQTYQRAAGMLFRETQFDDALVYLQKGLLDPLILLNTVPSIKVPSVTSSTLSLMSSGGTNSYWSGTIDDVVTSGLRRSYPDADDATLTSFGAALVENALQMILKYLIFVRELPIGSIRRVEIDSALLQIYADSDQKAMYTILTGDNSCDLEICETVLSERKKYYALSLLYKGHSQSENVLEIWMKIASGELEDPDFPGDSIFAHYLREIRDKSVVLKYADWVLQKDPTVGVQIFMDGSNKDIFDPDEVLDYLENRNQSALLIYLEYLIKETEYNDERRHNQLLMAYLDDVLRICTSRILEDAENEFRVLRLEQRQTFVGFLQQKSKQGDPGAAARSKLIGFLHNTTFYDPRRLLAEIKSSKTRLFAETAWLHGKLNEHDSALKILVDSLGDYAGAEEYIVSKTSHRPAKPLSSGSRSASGSVVRSSVNTSVVEPTDAQRIELRKSLLFKLVEMYLGPDRRDEDASEVLHLLNSYAGDLDLVQVLKLIPDYWSLDMLYPFISNGHGRGLTESRERRLLKSLHRAQNLSVNKELVDRYDSIPAFLMTEIEKAGRLPTNLCDHCGRAISEPPEFARLPDGAIVHIHCIKAAQAQTDPRQSVRA
ncbi:CNH domain-containing protein [Cladochytrium replicatum]|nr:CNH domain-containing protein [Cladochytrium replicatum]